MQKTIESVVTQKGAEFEFIVIDGGSHDGSKELIQSHADKIDYWVSEPDNGIYHAQNKGILKSKGHYCLFLNSGDFLCNTAVLKKVIDSGLDKDIVYGNMFINWGNNHITRGKMPERITKEHMYQDTLWHPVSFIRRGLFELYGLYNQEYKMVADYEFFFKTIIAQKVSTKHILVDICEYNTEGLSSDLSKKELENTERRKVIATYLTPEEIAVLETSSLSGKGWIHSVFRKVKTKFFK